MVTTVVDVRWFCGGHGNVGIVKVEHKFDGIKYYIGQCEGVSEEVDTNHIASWGSRFPDASGKILFGDL